MLALCGFMLTRLGVRSLSLGVAARRANPTYPTAALYRSAAGTGSGTVSAAPSQSGSTIRPIWNEAPGHWRGRVASAHRVPIGPGPFVDDAGRRVLQRFPEIIEIEIAPDHRDVLQRAVGHEVGKKAD